MSISVSVPKEITEYREKIVFGLSGRQLAFTGVTIVLAIGLGALCTMVMGLSIDTTGYVILAAATPLMALGFVRKEDMPLEQYIALLLRSKFGRNKLYYQTDLIIDKIHIAEGGPTGHEPVFKKAGRRGGEAVYRCRAAAGRKGQRKGAQRKIKAARQALRAAQRQAEKGAAGRT